jgi:hypothetical protein
MAGAIDAPASHLAFTVSAGAGVAFAAAALAGGRVLHWLCLGFCRGRHTTSPDWPFGESVSNMRTIVRSQA